MPPSTFRLLAASSLALALGVPTTLLAADPVPKGEVLKFTFENSKIFPGTVREYSVYVPRQYDPAKPACVHVQQDGSLFGNSGPEMLDEMIEKKQIPVIIGVFVRPGEVRPKSGNALTRFNRSYEYDGLGDGYARFLLDELLPEVEKKTTSDGRAIKLSREATTVRSAGPAAGQSPRSRQPGSAPTRSAGSSARSALMSASGEATSIRP